MANDPFVEMVGKTARVDLPLSDFQPVPQLRVAAHEIERPAWPAIDAHAHLDSIPLAELWPILDASGVERIVNISLAKGAELDEAMRRARPAPPERYRLFVLADWTPLARGESVGAIADELERRVEQGARGLKVWKDLGLTARDARGALLRVDDERLAPLFEKAGELQVPVMLHIGDPAAFFQPIDPRNERYEELAAHPEWSFHGPEFPAWEELLDAQERVIARHPRVRFLGAHVGGAAEDLARAAAMLERCPNLALDFSARAAELGRQPRTARAFFLRYADRILFGSDLLPSPAMYRLYYRFLETEDEYFPYPTHESGQGRWRIYGLGLPKDVLKKIYRTNAETWLGW